MQKRQLRIVIDTNLWISFLIGKELKELKNLLVEEAIQLIISEQIL